MPPRPVPRRPLPPRIRPRRLAALTAVLVAAPGLALLPAAPASAALSSPTAGSTVSGNVPVREAGGATNNCSLGQGSPYTRFQVVRVSDGATVGTNQQSGTGAKVYTWSSVGQPRGEYVARSWTRSANRSGFANLGCTNQGEIAQPAITFTVDNGAAVQLDLPDSVITGEDLDVDVSTTVVGTGVTGQPLGGREVTVTLPGVPDSEPVVVTTDDAGRASAEIDLPDLPVGALTVAAEVTTDAFYTGGDTTAETTLTPRSTEVLYRGQTRGQPGTDATLLARLIDATPDSDRFGERIAGRPVVLALGDDALPAATDADGTATRTAAVSGPSRVTEASASFLGDDVYAASSDSLKFYVGDVAAEPAPVVATPVQGNASGLVGWLGGLLGPVVTVIETIVSPVENAVGVPALSGLLDALVPSLQEAAGTAGSAVDLALDTIDREVVSRTPLGDLTQTARFTWRAVTLGEGGVVRAEEHEAVIGVPQLLDVTGDGTADLLATIRLSGFSAGLGTDGNQFGATPRIEIVRIGDVSQTLPLSLQAVLDLPGGEEEYRFGYDTREGNAPREFVADLVLADGGVTLQVASASEDALDITGAIVPAVADGETPAVPTEPADLDTPLPAPPAPAEQRFAISFDTAPEQAAIGVDLGGSSQLAARLSTDRPTTVGLSLTDDSGADRTFLADGLISEVEGEVAILVDGDTDSGLTADLTSPAGLDQVSLRAVELDAGRTASDVRLGLTDVPDSVSFALDAAGAGALTASGPIGVFEAGYAANRELALLDDPAYLRLDQVGDASSVALRLPGFEGLELDLTDDLAIGLTTAPTPLRAVARLEGLELDARVLDAPRELDLALGRDGNVRIAGSDPISEVRVDARDEAGIFDGSTDLRLRLVDVPSLLEVGVTDGGVSFGTGGQPIGSLEVFADSGTPVPLPEGPDSPDGLVLRSSPEGTQVAGRITGLRTIAASLEGLPEVLLDTVAGKVFAIELIETDGAGAETGRLTATVDRLVPNVRLALVDDGSGATRLRYTADEPTNALTFDLGELRGSISNPLPTALEVCQASDEACLPEVGIDDPTLGSVQLRASQTTTLDIIDPTGAFNVNGLRLRALDLTGSIDADNGGPLYLNTTEYGPGCEEGCARPIEGGSITADIDPVELTFTPGNGFNADRALTNLRVDKILGIPTGLSGVSGTGAITCVPSTVIRVRAFDLINVNIRDSLCNVPRTN